MLLPAVFKCLKYEPATSVKKHNYRNLKVVNTDQLRKDLRDSELCTNPPSSLDVMIGCYNTTLTDILNRHAPLKTRTVTVRRRLPWFNEDIREAKRARRRAEKRWRRTRSSSDFECYKKCRNRVTYLLNNARTAFYKDFIEENSGDQGKLFRATKRLLRQDSGVQFPPHDDEYLLANAMGNFFVKKVSDIRLDLDVAARGSSGSSKYDFDRPVRESFSEFKLLNDDDVLELVKKCAKKHCALDPMPTPLVAECMDVLLPVIKQMINQSLETASFPDSWKEAIVNLLLKRHGLDLLYKNYCPVSNLSYVSKLTERSVLDQLLLHMSSNGLYPVLQSSYRQHHSTETALLKVKSDILMNMNKGHVTLLVLLDLSAAFDTVDHGILITSLKSRFGVSGQVLEWFSGYLGNRSQRISVNGTLSDRFFLQYGVPQGSCLGPVLFIIYASKLFEIVKAHLPDVHCYADDSQLYLSFKPDSQAIRDEAVMAMQHCIEDIRQWMLTDRLKLNDDKIEYLLIGTRQQLSKISAGSLAVGDHQITPALEAKNLGCWFDQQLSMGTQINKICSASYFHLHNIRCIRKYLSTESTKKLVHALVTSRIDYCNSLLYGLPQTQLSKLQRVQNTSARLICNVSPFDHISPVLFRLHWLPVHFRIRFKILVITFKAIHELGPEYINDLIGVKSASRYSLRSNNELLLELPPERTKRTLGDRAFCVAAPKLWNSLPSKIRNSGSLNNFKNIYLFIFFFFLFFFFYCNTTI